MKPKKYVICDVMCFVYLFIFSFFNVVYHTLVNKDEYKKLVGLF